MCLPLYSGSMVMKLMPPSQSQHEERKQDRKNKKIKPDVCHDTVNIQLLCRGNVTPEVAYQMSLKEYSITFDMNVVI